MNNPLTTPTSKALADRGIQVERGTELAGLHDDEDGVRVVLRSGGTRSESLADVLAGCDGPASIVRSQAGIGWPGHPDGYIGLHCQKAVQDQIGAWLNLIRAPFRTASAVPVAPARYSGGSSR